MCDVFLDKLFLFCCLHFKNQCGFIQTFCIFLFGLLNYFDEVIRSTSNYHLPVSEYLLISNICVQKNFAVCFVDQNNQNAGKFCKINIEI